MPPPKHTGTYAEDETILVIRSNPLDQTRTVWLLTLAWALGMTWLSSLSGDSISLPSVGTLPVDKMFHYGTFLLGGYLLARAIRLSFNPRFLWTLVCVLLVLAAFGGFDEFHQTFVVGRSGGDLGDWIADVLGAGTGAILALKIHEQ